MARSKITQKLLKLLGARSPKELPAKVEELQAQLEEERSRAESIASVLLVFRVNPPEIVQAIVSPECTQSIQSIDATDTVVKWLARRLEIDRIQLQARDKDMAVIQAREELLKELEEKGVDMSVLEKADE